MNPLKRLFNFAIASGLLASLFADSAFAGELLPPGFRPAPLGTHALVGGRVVVKPGELLESGTVIIRNGLIEAAGTDVPAPADARVWDMKGKTIYAGFIEPYLVLNSTSPPVSTFSSMPIDAESLTAGGVKFYGTPGVKTDMGGTGPGSEVTRITPEARAVDDYSPREATLAPLRELGFTAAVIAPGRGIIRGTSALVALVDESPNRIILRPDVFQHIAFETQGDGAYPGSLMGVIAAIRQSFFDAQHYALDHADYERRPRGRMRPEFNPSLHALGRITENTMVIFEPGSALMNERAAELARESGFEYAVVSSGQEWRRPDLARATGATFIVPVNFPTIPKLPSEDDWEQISLDQLRAWDWAPENPVLLRQQGLEITFTTYGLGDKKSFRKNLRLALDRGLSEQDALAALTTVPARLCGVADRLGTVEPGKVANLTVVDGTNYFQPDAPVTAVWIDGRIFSPPPEEAKAQKAENPPPSTAITVPQQGETTPPKEEPETVPQPPSIAQEQAEKVATNVPPAAATPPTNTPPETAASATNAPAAPRSTPKVADLRKSRLARSPLEDRGPLASPRAIVLRSATIWTSGPAGVLTNADLRIADGKIVSVEQRNASQPVPANRTSDDTLEIDATGLHVTPGIIDCHSHTAILGNVNEPTLPSTAMVRIGDVVNSETDNLYQQLAGGVTTVNLLHGSANPISGQNCVIKLRNGAPPKELLFSNAPPGIKFALGENVKQSNWGERFNTRFPQSRMGVRTFFENRFTAARQYLAEWESYRSGAEVPPPGRDLELEAIGEILRGERLIHCHSYRQDEILAFLRTMESFGVTVASLQHVLEGYKVADEIAAHGAGASTFSDWWAYKFEVYDAIPYNGSLMHERGVLVSFNSDSSDLARRLYLEAAKAVKYGGTSESEAFKFVTINPAKQLGIDPYVGSLEPGKDADFAIWSKSPLDFETVCLQTWVDGKKYFDRSLEADRVERLKRERDDLIAKAKSISKGSSNPDAGGESGNSFFNVSLEHEFDGRDRHCMDGLQEER